MMETLQKHFFNRVTPFSKRLVMALFVALLALALYVGYMARSNDIHNDVTAVSDTAEPASTQEEFLENTKTYTNEVWGFSAEIPSDWTVTLGKGFYDYGDSTSVFISSPEYTEEKRTVPGLIDSEEMLVSKGARFSISLNKDIAISKERSNPEAYTALYFGIANDCSNCFGAEKISLGGQAALKQTIFVTMDRPGQEAVMDRVQTVRSGKEFTFRFEHLESSAEYDPVLRNFIRTFKFTE